MRRACDAVRDVRWEGMALPVSDAQWDEVELTKAVSLAALDRAALMRLRKKGRCSITLPEDLFDQEYPSHYVRRIKSVSLTIPAASGPSTTVDATLNERYMPFEGAGAVSEWSIELDSDAQQFDLETLSDVVIHIRHTAREG